MSPASFSLMRQRLGSRVHSSRKLRFPFDQVQLLISPSRNTPQSLGLVCSPYRARSTNHISSGEQMLADTRIFGGRTASRPVPRRGASKNAVRTSMLAHPHPRSPACRRVARMAAASAPDAYVSLLLVLLRYSDNPSFSWSSV